jgi:ATP-binding cassette subfamily B protein/subfamily B ATP-binding cassette protein MsbA
MGRQLRLLRYIGPHRRSLATILVTMVLSIGLNLLRPWPIKLLVDQIFGQQTMPAELDRLLVLLPGATSREGLLFWVAIGTVLIFLGETLLSMVSGLAYVRFGQRMTYDLGADLFLHLQRLSLQFHNRRAVGDMIARVTGDTSSIKVLVTGALLPLLQSLVTLITMFAIMWHLQPTMTMLSLSVIPFQMLAIQVFKGPMKVRSREARDLESHMLSVVQQALTAIPAVQAFTREELEHARFGSYADRAVAANLRSAFADMWFKAFAGSVTAVGTAGIIWLGGRYVLDGQMTTGSLLVFIAYLASLYAPLNSIIYTASTLQSAAASADRVMEIINTPADVRDLPDARDVHLRGHVRYEEVTFGYEPKRPVVKAVSFEAQVGETVALVGPTGAGKTTLVNFLVRFFDPWSGRVLIDDHDIRHLQVRSLRQQVAIVLQESFIFPLTIAENIAYGCPDASPDEIEAAAITANADDFIRRLPNGYDTVISERGATLSGGEKQRLSIARAFLKDAPILILDEPTSALDARTESLLLDALERLMNRRTTFIIAHRLSTIRNADRILVIDHGEIVEQGRHEELLLQDGLYASLYHQQTDIARHDVVADLMASYRVS